MKLYFEADIKEQNVKSSELGTGHPVIQYLDIVSFILMYPKLFKIITTGDLLILCRCLGGAKVQTQWEHAPLLFNIRFITSSFKHWQYYSVICDFFFYMTLFTIVSEYVPVVHKLQAEKLTSSSFSFSSQGRREYKCT